MKNINSNKAGNPGDLAEAIWAVWRKTMFAMIVMGWTLFMTILTNHIA